MRPRSGGPSDGEGGGAPREVDAGWDEMLAAPEASVTSRSDEVVPREAGQDAAADAGPRVAESSSTDLPTATLEQESNQPDDRIQREPSLARSMEAMMSGSWAVATRDGSPATELEVPTAVMSAAPSEPSLRESQAEMAAIMGTRVSPTDREPVAPAAVSPVAAARVDSRAPVPTTAAVDADATPTRPKTGPAGIVRPGNAAPARRMPSSEPRHITARTAAITLGPKPKRLSLGWAVVAGVGIAGIAWVVGGPIATNSPTTAGRATTDAKKLGAPAGNGGPVDPVAKAGREPADALPSESSDAALAALTDAGPGPKKLAPSDATEPRTPLVPDKPSDGVPTGAERPHDAGNRGVRTPPPGTPPEIAATFVRLPVSPADLPPVGGVGSSGIHVDRVEMGASYDNKTGCIGVEKRFSLAANEEINVCLRVVHPRQEEVMSIVWQKEDGSTARRGKIAVKPIHAYRTRAYLRLRAEYIGDWTVRITSPEGIELASHAFTITP